jgi:hypothetical protein
VREKSRRFSYTDTCDEFFSRARRIQRVGLSRHRDQRRRHRAHGPTGDVSYEIQFIGAYTLSECQAHLVYGGEWHSFRGFCDGSLSLWRSSINNGRLKSCRDPDNQILNASGFREMRFDNAGMRCVAAYDSLDLISVILEPDIWTSGKRIRLAGLIIEPDYQIAPSWLRRAKNGFSNLLLSFGTFPVNPALQLDINSLPGRAVALTAWVQIEELGTYLTADGIIGHRSLPVAILRKQPFPEDFHKMRRPGHPLGIYGPGLIRLHLGSAALTYQRV